MIDGPGSLAARMVVMLRQVSVLARRIWLTGILDENKNIATTGNWLPPGKVSFAQKIVDAGFPY